jgi:acyl-coenzyme A thioesterase PaaI-like protein
VTPLELAEAGLERSGLEFWRAVADGELPPPPIARLLDFAEIKEVGEGLIEFVGNPSEEHYNPIGVVHGGYAATLLDSALGTAVHTTLPAGTAYTTL